MRRALWKLLSIVAAVALAHGCAVNPVTGKSEIAFVSESQELEIGKKNYGPYRQAQGGDYVLEPQLVAYVDSVGQRLAKVADRKLPYEFTVINDSTPNAWALPGGKIAINRGLLSELDSEAELAAVLGHEIVHAAARHSAQSMERGVFLQGALIAAGVALGGSDYQELGMMGAGIGAQLVNQKYGRDDETEADVYGMRYMLRAGYDPAAAVGLQETFVRLAEGRESNWLEGLFASHPPSRERVEANRRMVAELGNPGGEVGEKRYRQAIARIKRNKPAYEAFDEAQQAFKEKDLKTAMTLVDRAIAIEPEESAFHTLRGEIRAARSDYQGAMRDLDKAVALNSGYYRPLLLRGITRRELGDSRGASRDLERSVSMLPTAEGFYDLGLIAQAGNDSNRAIGYFRKASTSTSEIGNRAGRQLARLDLQNNPSRYLSARLGLSGDGFLVVQVDNPTPVAVRDVEVAVGQRSGSGIAQARRYELGRALAAGNSARLRTGIRPLTSEQARRLGAVVTRARVSE
jgi:predicted Zn-dependent protease